jgi:hypothetical protein
LVYDVALRRVFAKELCLLCDLKHDLLDGIAPFHIDDECAVLEVLVVPFSSKPHSFDD